MANWIFQGNPKQFDVDTYLKENKVVTWGIRQKQFKDEMQRGDRVFIWRSDGGERNTGGVVASGKITSAPFIDEDDGFSIEVEITDFRLTPDSGMLLRHELKEIPDTMNLQIFKISQLTNYRLTDEEFNRLYKYWQNPQMVKEILELPTIEKYLYAFREVADEWFKENTKYIEVGYHFFDRFKQRDHLQQMEWEDVQEIGNHINAFRMALSKKRALGKMNAPIEKYRKSFEYLFYGQEPIENRIDNFISNEEYKLFGFGMSVVSEIVGNVFADDYCFYNQRDKVAVENILQLTPDYSRGDSEGRKFIKFQNCLKENQIIEKYLEIIGKRTNLPIYYEVDQFFSFLFENYGKKGKDITDVQDDLPQYWLLAAGENAVMWDDFYQNGLIAIGWEEIGDLKKYNSKREIADVLKEVFQLENNPTNDALANYQFAYEMKIGDYVFIKRGTKQIIGFGKIVSDYQHDPTRETYHSVRKVDWISTGEWNVDKEPIHMKTLTNITRYEDYVERLLDKVGKGNSSTTPPEGNKKNEELAPYTVEQINSEVFMTNEQIEEILETLDYKKNIILQGPPGVGKTFVAKRLAYLHMGVKDDSKIEFLQFHQSYSYEDFIRGYKPNLEGNFILKDGLFYTFCKKAVDDPENNYYMIIDEINRGNLSKIFGELMMLIEADKRGKKFAVKLAYSLGEETFYIPSNLYLIGTMNTADRSLALVDYALRRRFSFINVEPAFHTDGFKDYLISKGISQGFIEKLIHSIDEVNQEIVSDKINLGKGYEIGHSYFCPTVENVDDEQKWYERIIRLEIAPLLKEYWFDREDKVNDILNRLQ